MKSASRFSRRTFLLTSTAAIACSLTKISRANTRAILKSESATFYQPRHDGIWCHNGQRYGNRPLYGDHRSFTALAGDRPLLRLMGPPVPLGAMMFALKDTGNIIWLHDFSSIDTRYQAGQTTWHISDPRFAGVSIQLDAITMSSRDGAIVRIQFMGVSDSSQLLIAYGGLMDFSSENLLWAADPGLHPSVQKSSGNYQGSTDWPTSLNDLELAFNSEHAFKNQILSISKNAFSIGNPITGAKVKGITSATAQFFQADARAWSRPEKLISRSSTEFPLVVGLLPIAEPIFIAVEQIPSSGIAVNAKSQDKSPILQELIPSGLNAAFATACSRLERVRKRVRIRTPDAQLDQMLPCAAAAIDAIFYGPEMVHGAMSWNIPFIGWRSFYGSTCLGWHERLLTVARHYLPKQNKTAGPVAIKQDVERRLSMPAEDSRFYGKGFIPHDQKFYNMQSVFFDQLIHAWTSSGDHELEKLLYPALSLHLEWLEDCFGRDGLYESFLDVWASDSLWYSGGPTACASGYAFRAYEAAALLAKRAGDDSSALDYRKRTALIRELMSKKLWSPSRGCLAEYIEGGALKRQHDDASLYAVAIPIDCGAVSEEMAVQMMDYSSWGLERVPMSAGGEQCYTSNFVPHVWSVREADTADTLHLSLAAYKSGLPTDGWKLLQGGFRQSGFASATPGAIMCEPPGKKYSSVDFSDSTNMFVRTTIEGLFGYTPDRVNGLVTVAPQFPPEWEHAELVHPDVTISFKRENGIDSYRVKLARPARVALRVPLRSRRMVEAKEVKFVDASWEGPALVRTSIEQVSEWTLQVPYNSKFGTTSDDVIFVQHDSILEIASKHGHILEFADPQGVLEGAKLAQGVLSARVRSGVEGRHLIIADVIEGSVRWRKIFRIEVKRPANVSALNSQTECWRAMPLASLLDADLQEIYKQKYLSPRPAVISAQIGNDGFSWWTATFWKVDPPKIGTAHVPPDGRMIASNGIPFTLSKGKYNIAFTSTWDNWPTRRKFPVGRSGKQIALLLAGTTNQMQTGIANGIIRLRYSDDQIVTHELVHPTQFWDLAGDYDYEVDAFSLPKAPPPTVQLDEGTRAVAFYAALRADAVLHEVELETLSPEVVIGLMAISIC